VRLWAALLLLTASAGCDKLFSIDKVTIDASIDAPPDVGIDAPMCENSTPFGTNCRMITLPLTEDTYLQSSDPATAFGTLDAVRTTATDPALFKFFTGGIAADERIAEMTLELDPYFGMMAKACHDADHTTCGMCPPADIGVWQIAYVRTDWMQSEATWNQVATSVAWREPGAAAIPDDRSDVLASGPGVASGQLFMTIPGSVLLQHSPDCYRSADSIALRVTTQGLSYFEAQELNLCAGDSLNPTLAVTLCK
jgi:hypothetical protein